MEKFKFNIWISNTFTYNFAYYYCHYYYDGLNVLRKDCQSFFVRNFYKL